MNWKDFDIRTIAGFAILLVVVVFMFLFLLRLARSPTIELKMLLGFTIIVALFCMGLIGMLGKVPEKAPGVELIIGVFATMGAGFTYWAFTKDKPKE